LTFVILFLAAIIGLAVLPQMWVQRVIARHSADRPDFPGTGGELARHLLDELRLGHVKVEETKDGDHYDPDAKAVRLAPQHFNGRSLAALVIAAHETGHAMQDATEYPPLKKRTVLARQAATIERVGAVIMLAAPIMVVLARSPTVLALELLAGALILGTTIIMHAYTLPVDKDLPAARQLLRAAAFTYVAAAAMSMLDVVRWLRVLRL